MTEYSVEEHKHRFACWAAVRASQRGLKGATLERIEPVLAACGVRERLREKRPWSGVEEFDTLHRTWCRALVDGLHRAGLEGVTYGRAAKLIAIYLKSVVIMDSGRREELGAFVHPPIDRVLLQTIARTAFVAQKSRGKELQETCRRTNWTQLTEEDYVALIDAFREAGLDEPVFWKIERFWNPTG